MRPCAFALQSLHGPNAPATADRRAAHPLRRQRSDRRRRTHARTRHGRDRLRGRKLRLRQDDAAARDCGLHSGCRRHHRDRRPRRRRTQLHRGAGEARRGAGVPGLRALPSPASRRQRRVRAAPSGDGRAPRARRRDARTRRAHARSGALPARVVRRPAAARRAGARARPAARAAADGRAVLEPRRRTARASRHRGAPDPEGERHHGGPRDPRPAGSLRDRGPRRRDERRPPRAVGPAVRAVSPSRDALCRGLHRRRRLPARPGC